jgi:ADP-ribose pyrophosphatase YjhB (NUDIX family)
MNMQTTWIDWTGQPVTRTPDRLGTSVSACVFDVQGRLLLMHRADNAHWCVPGGNMEIGESVTQATAREVFEETGLIIDVGRLIGVYSDPANHMIATYPNGYIVHYVNLCFVGRVTGGTLRGSEEGEEVGFFAPDALPAPILLPHQLRIQDALARQEIPFIR